MGYIEWSQTVCAFFVYHIIIIKFIALHSPTLYSPRSPFLSPPSRLRLGHATLPRVDRSVLLFRCVCLTGCLSVRLFCPSIYVCGTSRHDHVQV